MIHMRLKGGMGNQMFQYALGLELAKRLNTELRLDLSSLLDRSKGKDFVYRGFDLDVFTLTPHFTISPAFLKNAYRLKSALVTKLIRKQLNRGKPHFKEAHFHYMPDLFDQAKDNAIYEGWFQSEKYFPGVGAELRQAFEFRHGILETSKPLFQKIKNTNAICLNVRRTDFLKVNNLNTTDKDYFLNAAEQMAYQLDDPHFYIFSDDVKWCAAELELPFPYEVVDHNHKGFKFSNYMQLMSACQHYIVPNSSFAWWSIWLNTNPDKKVIAPKNWFNDPEIDTSDLVPASWMRL